MLRAKESIANVGAEAHALRNNVLDLPIRSGTLFLRCGQERVNLRAELQRIVTSP
jgi:hypothetical protein